VQPEMAALGSVHHGALLGRQAPPPMSRLQGWGSDAQLFGAAGAGESPFPLEASSGPGGLQRSWSEPVFAAGSPTGNARACYLSPTGLTSPALRATSLLHQRHQADMVKYGQRPLPHAEDVDEEGGREAPAGRQREPWDLRRTPAHRQGAQYPEFSKSNGRLAKLVHVRNQAAGFPPEQTFAMPHPFHGHAPRDGPAQGRTPHSLKPLSASRRRRDPHPHSPVPGAPFRHGSWAQLRPCVTLPSRSVAAHHPEPARNCGEEPDAGYGERQEDIEHISIAKLYNAVVDGLAGHLIVDTRCADDYDQGHIWGAIDLEEALTYRGKHILLVSQTGDVGPTERQAVEALEGKQGMLSLKNVQGGMEAWVREYPFMCECTAASLDEEHQQRRERSRHIYPSQVP